MVTLRKPTYEELVMVIKWIAEVESLYPNESKEQLLKSYLSG